MAVVAARELRRNYGSFTALAGVSFDIEAGQIVGLLGPNGAGKSTTMKILTGFLAPTGGSATVCGHDVLTHPVEVRKNIGYLPESAPIYEDMTVRSFLVFIARTRGLGAAGASRAISRVLDECGLMDREHQRISTLSKGYRQRVGLAQALLHEPKLLILDEPTNGLDPSQIIEIRNLIRRVGETRTVILSTHILSEVQVTCDRVMIINQGRMVADGATDDVVASTTGHKIVLGLAPGKVQVTDPEVCGQLAAIDGVDQVHAVTPDGDTRRFHVHAAEDVRRELFRWAVGRGHELVELSGERSNLEEVFLRLTEGGASPQAPVPAVEPSVSEAAE
ncbi:MAG: ATP-binding cassette domain-containing protein [Myxococcota bacterium]